VLTVRDTGEGIRAELGARVFELFVQSRKRSTARAGGSASGSRW